MAGESPDKVEREESSGETTGGGGAVASSGGKKPREKAARKRGSGQSAKAAKTAKTAKTAKSAKAAKSVKSAKAAKPAKEAGAGKAAGTAKKAKSAKPAARSAKAADGPDDKSADSRGTGENSAPVAATAGEDAVPDSAAPGIPDDGKTSGSVAATDGGNGASAAAGSGSEPGAGGDDRLKAAVAAWVAGTDDEPDGEAPAAGDADGEFADEHANSGSEEGNSSQSSVGGLPPRPKSGGGEEPEDAEAAGTVAPPGDKAGPRSTAPEKPAAASTGPGRSAGEVDQPTAMFRTVRPDSGGTADEDEEEAARRAERMTAAFFGSSKTSKPEKGDESPGAEGSEDSGAGDRPTAEQPETGTPETGTPAAPGPQAGQSATEQPETAKSEAPEPADKPEPGGTDAGADTFRVDEPTAVFRTVERGEGAKQEGVDQSTAVFRTVEPPKSDAPEASGADAGTERAGKEAEPSEAKADASAKPAKPVDPRAVVDAGDADGPSAEPERPAADASDSAPLPAAEPAPAADSDSDADADADSDAESESERTSQFVPLKSADAPPRPRQDPAAPPKPLGGPATDTAPAEAPAEAPVPQLTEAERTRQQPRPDQAPLDLLAQLTNTPPPPETPLRTAARRVKIWTPLVVLLAIVFVVAQSVRPLPEPVLSLTASPTYTFQGAKPSVPWPSEGQATLDVQGLGSLGTYGKQKPVPIASVAKVMTAYVILRDHPVKKGSDGATIPVDKKAEEEAGLSAQNESTVEVKQGDKISQREAVEALMIASANNVARLLARWDAGSEKAFAKKMNAAAKDLGMTNTRYTDPSGLNASTVSTSEDQVKLAKKAMAMDLFRETVRLPGYTDTKGDEHGNWNKLVPLDGVVGIKTGTTTKAGGNLLFAAEQKVGGTEQLIVGAVLGQYRPSILDTVLAESKKLIDSAQEELRTQKVVRKGDVVGYVDDQLGGKTPVVATEDVSAVGWSGLKVKLGLTDGGKPLPNEGSAGDNAGTLTVGDGPGQVRVPVTLKEDMTEPGFGAKLTRIL